MNKPQKIMVALAFSEFSEMIFNYAAGLAGDLGARLVAVHIIDLRYVEAIGQVESMGYQISSEDFVKGFLDERTALLDEMARKASFPKDRLTKIVKVGHPVDQLLKIIRQEKVDMVVVGTRSHSAMPHILVGSVAEKVFHHSPVPVVSVRTEEMKRNGE